VLATVVGAVLVGASLVDPVEPAPVEPDVPELPTGLKQPHTSAASTGRTISTQRTTRTWLLIAGRMLTQGSPGDHAPRTRPGNIVQRPGGRFVAGSGTAGSMATPSAPALRASARRFAA
jgi:hypothetical protein